MFDTEYRVLSSASAPAHGRRYIIRSAPSRPPALPPTVAALVDFISPGARLPTTHTLDITLMGKVDTSHVTDASAASGLRPGLTQMDSFAAQQRALGWIDLVTPSLIRT